MENNINFKDYITKMAQAARIASLELANFSTAEKNKCLKAIAKAIEANKDSIKAANNLDIKKAKEDGLSSAMIDRLTLTDKRIQGMVENFEQVATLDDPVGDIIKSWERPNGLKISKIRVPIGVIGIIFESRPNVTCEAVSLCLKSGNAVILRGGKEALNSNVILAKIISQTIGEQKFPYKSVQMIDNINREIVNEFLKLNDYIDLIIPRGGESLIRAVVQNSTIPVIKHYKGVCHTYIDENADYQTAENIVINAKTQRPGVCNALETLLIHEKSAGAMLPELIKALKSKGVEIRGCEKTKAIVNDINSATKEDWSAEYLELILAVKVVKNIDEAIKHINTYGSKHSDAIVTNNNHNAAKFMQRVDASAVFVNASTRFNDGGEFGFGAEIGISTDKLHARGPMALEELTTYKYLVKGEGQIRS